MLQLIIGSELSIEPRKKQTTTHEMQRRMHARSCAGLAAGLHDRGKPSLHTHPDPAAAYVRPSLPLLGPGAVTMEPTQRDTQKPRPIAHACNASLPTVASLVDPSGCFHACQDKATPNAKSRCKTRTLLLPRRSVVYIRARMRPRFRPARDKTHRATLRMSPRARERSRRFPVKHWTFCKRTSRDRASGGNRRWRRMPRMWCVAPRASCVTDRSIDRDAHDGKTIDGSASYSLHP